MAQPIFDLHSVSKGLRSFDANIGTDGDAFGPAIDRLQAAGFFQAVEFYIGARTLADGDYTWTIQHADDDGAGSPGTFADVGAGANEEHIGGPLTFASTDDDTVKRMTAAAGTLKRHVRLKVTSANVTTGGDFYALAVLHSPVRSPVAND